MQTNGKKGGPSKVNHMREEVQNNGKIRGAPSKGKHVREEVQNNGKKGAPSKGKQVQNNSKKEAPQKANT